MSIQLNEANSGKVFAIHISGKLDISDYEKYVAEFERFVQRHEKLGILLEVTQFQGWDASVLVYYRKFSIKQFVDIDRIAIVGDKKWHHGMVTICKPFTKATIYYFNDADSFDARKWLIEQ